MGYGGYRRADVGRAVGKYSWREEVYWDLRRSSRKTCFVPFNPLICELVLLFDGKSDLAERERVRAHADASRATSNVAEIFTCHGSSCSSGRFFMGKTQSGQLVMDTRSAGTQVVDLFRSRYTYVEIKSPSRPRGKRVKRVITLNRRKIRRPIYRERHARACGSYRCAIRRGHVERW